MQQRTKCMGVLLVLLVSARAQAAAPDAPIVNEDVIFEEIGGMVAVEAEFFSRQTKTDIRRWYRTTAHDRPKVGRDPDGPHVAHAGIPAPFPVVDAAVEVPAAQPSTALLADVTLMNATDFPVDGTGFYVNNQWLAINPNEHREAETRMPFELPDGRYDVVFFAVGENDGQSTFRVTRNDEEIGHFVCPLSSEMFAEGPRYTTVWESVEIARGDAIAVEAKVGSADGQEYSRGRWAGLAIAPIGRGRAVSQTLSPATLASAERARGQVVGLRFQGVTLSKGSDIERAYVQFTVDEDKNANPFEVVITGEAHDNAATFGLANKDISGRPRTQASVVWKDVEAWTGEGTAGPAQQTPDLSKIVREIIQRHQWRAGNALALIFEGTGIRTAVSHEKSERTQRPEMAPKLVVVLGSGETKVFPVAQGSDDMEEFAATGIIDAGSTDLEFCWEELRQAQGTAQVEPPVEPIDLTEFFSDPTIRQPDGGGRVTVSGTPRQWHKVTLTLDGPYAHELDKAPNPFTDYRMTVVFTHRSGEPVYRVPGYFAADGNAAESGADCGNKWRAHLAPNKTGRWSYEIQFVKGAGVAVNDASGEPVKPYHGKQGIIRVRKSNKKAPDMRARGLLQYVGEHYLKFAGSGEYFLKCGADAPENLLAYADFDGPFKVDGHKDHFIKTWEPHVKDWRPGDPTWQGGKGKGLIGAINYLASEGMNVFSFLTLNIAGDDRNVFPYTHYDERFNMDCSRLDQWEIIFSQGTKMGMFLHFKTLETENELLLDRGELGPERKLYYRELIARFAHHPALNWNLGEEINNATTEQKQAWAHYIWDNDPYHHHLVIHNAGDPHYDLMGDASPLTGFSLQTSQRDFRHVHRRTLDYINRSKAAGKPWAVACDEPGDASVSLVPDKDDPEHRDARVNGLWGHFTAGGWGTEWYFGYQRDHSDLTCEDWRSRDLFWDQCRHALKFFRVTELPVWEMSNADDLVEGDAFCLARKDGPYLVFLKTGGTVTLDLTEATTQLRTRWYNPRTGKFAKGKRVKPGRKVTLGPAPSEPDMDWVVLLD